MCMGNTDTVRDFDRRIDRACLRRKMLEKQAIDNGPEMFDFWADEIEKVDQEIMHLGIERLKAKAVEVGDPSGYV